MKEQLSKAEAFSTPDLLLRRTVGRPLGRGIHADDIGRVCLQAKEGHVVVYLNAEDTRSGKFPWYQINEELCKFFEIASTKRDLAMGILAMDDVGAIEDMLERNDVFQDPEPSLRQGHDNFNHNIISQQVPSIRHEVTPATPISSNGTNRPTTPLFGGPTNLRSRSPGAASSSRTPTLSSSPVSPFESSSLLSLPTNCESQSSEATSSSGAGTLSPSSGLRCSASPSRSLPSNPTNHVIDPARIEAAAQSSRSERVLAVSAAELEANSDANPSVLALPAAPSLRSSTQESSEPRISSDEPTSFVAKEQDAAGPFSLQDMQNTLPSAAPKRLSFQRSPETSSTYAPPPTLSRPPTPSCSLIPSRSSGGGYEQEIGYGGELFVRQFPPGAYMVSGQCQC